MVKTGRLGQNLYDLKNDYEIAENFFLPTNIIKDEPYITETTTEHDKHKETQSARTTFK